MADDRKISIEIEAKDYASSVFRSVSSGVSTFAINANNGIIRANNALRQYNNTMRGFNTTVQTVLVDAGKAIYNFTTDAIKQFAALEQQHARTMGAMSSDYDFNFNGKNTAQQQANMQKFYADSDSLKKQAYKLGIGGPDGNGSLYEPAEISAAQTALVKAGISPKDIISTNAINDVIKFAGGNELGIDKAVEFAVQLGTQFKIDPSGWGDMLDQVTYAANASVIDVEDVMESMKYAGNMAAGYDQPLSDVLAALAVMGNAGLKGGQAGTGIQALFARGMVPTGLSKLAPAPDKEVEKIYKDFSSKVVDKNGMFMGLENYTDELATTMEGLTDVQKSWFVRKMFGMFQQKAALALGRTDKDGDTVFAEMADKIKNNSEGTNDAVYQLMIESSGGQLQAVEKAYAGFQEQFGDALSPVTKEVTRQMIKAFVTGNFNFDFDSVRKALKTSADAIDKQYGEQISQATQDVGNFMLDLLQIGQAEIPMATGTGEGIIKLLNGDFGGAWDEFTKHIEDTNTNIDGLPDDIQDTATAFKNLILVLEGLFALNIGTRIAEGVTSVIRLLTGGRIISAKSNVTSASTTITAGAITSAMFGSVANATIASMMANTATMTVYANIVNIIGGVGGLGTGGGLTGPLAGAGGALLAGAGAGAATGGTAALGGAASRLLLPGATGAAGGFAWHGASQAVVDANGKVASRFWNVGGKMMSGSQILAAAGKMIGVAGAAGTLMSLSGDSSNASKTYSDYYNKGSQSGLSGQALRQYVIDNAPPSTYDDVTGKYKSRAEYGKAQAASWYDSTMNTAAFMSSSTGIQKIYDALAAQINSGGKISDKFLQKLFSDNGISTSQGQSVITQMLNTMFDAQYKSPSVYSGRFANQSIDKFVRANVDNKKDWSQYGTFKQMLAAFSGKLNGMTYVNGSDNIYKSTSGDYFKFLSDGTLQNVTNKFSTASITLSDAVNKLISSKTFDKLSLGQGPISDKSAENYIMGQLGSPAGVAANQGLLQQINAGIAALDPTLTVDIANKAPVVNVKVDVDVDKNGNIKKNVITDYNDVDNWLYKQTHRFGGTVNIGGAR